MVIGFKIGIWNWELIIFIMVLIFMSVFDKLFFVVVFNDLFFVCVVIFFVYKYM